MQISPLQKARAVYKAKLPSVFSKGAKVSFQSGQATTSVADQDKIKELFPNTYGTPILTVSGTEEKTIPALNVGVILSGGQAPGGHNVIAGIFDGIKSLNPNSKLYGFCGGPSGLVDKNYIELTAPIIDQYRNTGGFDIIGSGRTKLEDKEQFDKGLENCKSLGIHAIVIIGGDDSNTNACVLAEYYKSIKAGIQVIGCPKTIDGDLKNKFIETSFGFDTACKVYSQLIGNIQRDALSAKKYWHFIKLMGRSASHITLECGLQTRANITLISEEVESKKLTLAQIVNILTNAIVKRANKGENFGVILIPEGLIEFIPEFKNLISQLNDLLANNEHLSQNLSTANDVKTLEKIGLQENSAKVYLSLPNNIKEQLIMDRDPHGNVQVSRIETEKLLISMVEKHLAKLKQDGIYKGVFSAQNHFFGYEGRCATPSNFDADYCYSLGYTAAALLGAGKTAYLSSVRNLKNQAKHWIAGGIPLTSMMNIEKRHGNDKPVIKKALVKLDGTPFKQLQNNRKKWTVDTSYIFPGPIQYFGPSQVCDLPTKTLILEQQ